MDEILEILEKDARNSAQEIAKMTGKSAKSVAEAIKVCCALGKQRLEGRLSRAKPQHQSSLSWAC